MCMFLHRICNTGRIKNDCMHCISRLEKPELQYCTDAIISFGCYIIINCYVCQKDVLPVFRNWVADDEVRWWWVTVAVSWKLCIDIYIIYMYNNAYDADKRVKALLPVRYCSRHLDAPVPAPSSEWNEMNKYEAEHVGVQATNFPCIWIICILENIDNIGQFIAWIISTMFIYILTRVCECVYAY